MDKVKVLTYFNSDNFGSVLQAYAINTYINLIGYDCEIIDYKKPKVQKLYSIFNLPTNRFLFFMNIYNCIHLNALVKRKKNYAVFRKEMFRIYHNRSLVRNDLNTIDGDIFLVGSDQVWNPDIVDFDDSYLLTFTSKKKIAYAASFGPKGQPSKFVELFKGQLGLFESVMVREQKAVSFCSQSLNIEATLVCDPVFLLAKCKWEAIEKKVDGLQSEYILCYFAGGVSHKFEQYTIELSKKMGCQRILLISDWHNIFKPGKRLYSAGPAEFIYLIRNAKIVCTNSFHATAFSIIFEKYLIVDDSNNDERIRTILDYSGNKNCYFDSSVKMIQKAVSTNIEFIKFVENSKQLLRQALGEKND